MGWEAQSVTTLMTFKVNELFNLMEQLSLGKLHGDINAGIFEFNRNSYLVFMNVL